MEHHVISHPRAGPTSLLGRPIHLTCVFSSHPGPQHVVVYFLIQELNHPLYQGDLHEDMIASPQNALSDDDNMDLVVR